LNASCVNLSPAFQRLKLPAETRQFVVEFGSFATTATVGNHGHNNGWQAHHYPAEKKQ
jgi:hypothetical protein